MQRPMAGITTQCHGWLASFVSFGRTSTPQVSVQIAAISFPGTSSNSRTSPRSRRRRSPQFFSAWQRSSLPSAHDHEVAAADSDILVLVTAVELIVGNAFTIGHPLHTPRKRAISSSTPRPTILFLECSMPSLVWLAILQIACVQMQDGSSRVGRADRVGHNFIRCDRQMR